MVGSTVETVKLDGAMQEIFALQDEVLKALMDSLRLQISDSEVQEIERPETEDLEAYAYCARARELAYRMGPQEMEEAARWQSAWERALACVGLTCGESGKMALAMSVTASRTS